MQAIMAYMERVNEQLLGGGKIIESNTKKDIKITALNLATQMGVRLTDIIYDDSPHWQDYIKNLTRVSLI